MVICAVLLLSAQPSDFEPDVKKWTPEYESKMRHEMMDALKVFTRKYNTVWNDWLFSPSEFEKIRVIDKTIVSAMFRSSGYQFIFSQDKWRVKTYFANPGILPLSKGAPIGNEVELDARVRLEFGDYLDAFAPTSSRYNYVRSPQTGNTVAGMVYSKPGKKKGELDLFKVSYRTADGMLSGFSIDPYPEFPVP